MSYNRRGGGNYGSQGRGNYGGGGNRSNNRGGNDSNSNYLNASSVKKYIHEGDGPKQRVDIDEFLTEEIGFSLTYDKVQDLIARLKAASDDAAGTGGAYVNMYISKKKNNSTGEPFDGLRILVNKQNPPDERFQRGGNFRGNAGGGRRDYPSRGGNGGGHARSNNYNNAPQNNYTPPAEPRQEEQRQAPTNNQQQYANEPEF